MNRVRTAGSACHQVTARAVNELLDGSIGRSEMADEDTLMILGPPFQHRGDECNPEAPAPVPAEVGQARTFVVLVLGQIRVRKLCYWNEHERVAESLETARQCEMKIVCLGSESAVVKHRKRRDGEAGPQEAFRTDARDDSDHKGSQDRDHRSSGAQDQPCVSRGIAKESLKNLRDQHCAAKQSERENKVVDARESEVPLAQQS